MFPQNDSRRRACFPEHGVNVRFVVVCLLAGPFAFGSSHDVGFLFAAVLGFLFAVHSFKVGLITSTLPPRCPRSKCFRSYSARILSFCFNWMVEAQSSGLSLPGSQPLMFFQYWRVNSSLCSLPRAARANTNECWSRYAVACNSVGGSLPDHHTVLKRILRLFNIYVGAHRCGKNGLVTLHLIDSLTVKLMEVG